MVISKDSSTYSDSPPSSSIQDKSHTSSGLPTPSIRESTATTYEEFGISSPRAGSSMSREVATFFGRSTVLEDVRYSLPPPAYDDLYVPIVTTSRPIDFLPSPAHPREYPFAPSPDGPYPTPLPGDNPKGLLDRINNLAPGKSSVELLNPPPASFRRMPPADLLFVPFPTMVIVAEGTTIDKGFAYVAPESTVVPHPFRTRDVNEHDWRQFLHDMRLAGSLSPGNRVVSGLMPLATGVGIIFPVQVVRGVETLMRKSKVKGPVSQLLDYWNNLFFNPRHMHVSLTQGPPKYVHVQPDLTALEDKKWRLVISYRPAYAIDGSSITEILK